MPPPMESLAIPFPCWCLVERQSIEDDLVEAREPPNGTKFVSVSDRRGLNSLLAVIQRSVVSVSLDPGRVPGGARVVWPLDIVIDRIRSSRGG